MKFRYKRYSPSVLRPVIPIKVFYKGKGTRYEVLIDSGADISIFSSVVAETLGIKMTTGEKSLISGVTGDVKPYWIHKVDLLIGERIFKNVKVGFFQGMEEDGYGIVGQKGFFELFVVKFDLKAEEIELKIKRGPRKS